MTLTALLATRSTRMRASEIRELLKLLDQPDIHSFAGGIPDPALFPVEAFHDAYAEVLSADGAGTALQYQVSEGYEPLRGWVAEEMTRQGVPYDVGNVFITSGSQQALDYLGKLFLSPGDTAFVEWPTYLGALQAFNAYEPHFERLTPSDGNRVLSTRRESARAAGGTPKFAYLVPDFANPTGRTLGLAERHAVLEVAHGLGIAVIEDAAYRSLRYGGCDLPSLLALDCARSGGIEKARTIYCGSFSKVLAPGLRVGWVCAPRAVIEKLVLAKQASDLHSPSINQVVVHRVAQQYYDRQVEAARATYRSRRDGLLEALSASMPAGVTWTEPDGGMFVWLTLAPQMDAAALLRRAIVEARVAFVPGAAFYPDGSGRNCLRMSFTLATPESLAVGIPRLAALIADASGAKDRPRSDRNLGVPVPCAL